MMQGGRGKSSQGGVVVRAVCCSEDSEEERGEVRAVRGERSNFVLQSVITQSWR